MVEPTTARLQSDAAALTSLQAAVSVVPPPPLQPRVPRAPIRIVVLCDGTAQQRNWVKTSLNTATAGQRFHTSSRHKADRGDDGANKRKGAKGDVSTAAAQSGDFFTNVALLAKVIAQSSGVATPSPVPSPTLGSSTDQEMDKHADAEAAANSGAAAGVMAQVVFYQSGVGTGTGVLQNLFDQGTGLSLGSKIEEAYSFIVDNYQPGDELFLFGFSRGAYTARCISGLINWCGILNKVEMTHFADIWAAYQRRDPDDIQSEVDAAQVLYAATLRYPSAESEQIATSMYRYNLEQNKSLSDEKRAELVARRSRECEARRSKALVVPPQIKVVGVWDTVSALGFPGLFQDNAMIDFFDFYDPGLGSNVQFGFHALSLEEDRKDFLPTMWYQPSVGETPSGVAQAQAQAQTPTRSSGEFGVRGQHMRSKQVLKQCWFQGVHTDCGGGYQYHGLSDIALIWMVSQLVDPHTLPDGSTTLRPLLNIDLGLLVTILDRRREWAKQLPHRSRPTVNYQRARTVCQSRFDAESMKRVVWASMAKTGLTHESIHPSVACGGRINPSTHPAFAELRMTDEAKLGEMWAEAQDWNRTLRPTEKLLRWNARGPYPWVPTEGDVWLNPLISPLVITGGWNIPELASSFAQQKLIEAAAAAAVQSADVDDLAEQDHNVANAKGNAGKAGNGAELDGQPLDGRNEEETRASSPPRPSDHLALTSIIVASYPLIPAKELGENPVDATRHPHLHTLWQTLYNLAATPNALLANMLNWRLVPTANLNQTTAQACIWNLGDTLAGYSSQLKLQALTAGVVHSAQANANGNSAKGKRKRKPRTDIENPAT